MDPPITRITLVSYPKTRHFPGNGLLKLSWLTDSAANLRFCRPLWKAASTVVGALGFVTFLFVQILPAVGPSLTGRVHFSDDHYLLAYPIGLFRLCWVPVQFQFAGFTIEDI